VTRLEDTGFRSDDTLPAFGEEGLDSETRKRVNEQMTASTDCYSTLFVPR